MTRIPLKHLFFVAAAVLAGWIPGSAREANATPINYTFTGIGTGDIGTTAFSGAFTFVFNGNTTGITSGGGETFNEALGGTFSGGGFSGTLLSNNAVIVNNDPAFPRLSFFNSTFDNGGTLQNSVFTPYLLATSLGPVTVTTGPDLLPTLNLLGDGFGTTGGGPTIELLSISSLTFTATTAAVPEPASLTIFGASLAAYGFIRRRRRKAV
jgi:hypothetical protein